MAQPGVGHEFPARKVSWLKRDVLLFNLSIGCRADEPHFVYVSLFYRFNSSFPWLTGGAQENDRGFAAFPTLPLGLGTASSRLGCLVVAEVS